MKRPLLLSAGTMALIALFIFNINSQPDPEGMNPKLRYDLSTAAGQMAYHFDQKVARRAKAEPGPNQYDNPDLAMAMEVSDRSEVGQPYSYTGSYRFTALREALASQPNQQRELLPWVERGPGNVGGRTRALLVHPDSSSVWLAGAVGGGIWKTENAGLNWRSVSDDLPILSVTALARCDSTPDIVYAGTGEGFYNSDAVIGDGLFKSLDGGETWQQILSTISQSNFKYVNRIIVSPSDPDLLVVATNSGIQRSADGGQTWTEVYDSGSRVQQIIANPQNFHTQFATVNETGIIKSEDAGLSWFSSSNFSSGFKRIEMAMAPSDTSIVYAALTSFSSSLFGLFRSSDAGATWTNLGDSPNWLGSQGWYDNTIVVSPYNANELIVGGLNLYRVTAGPSSMSANRLTNWYPGAGFPYVHADQHMLVTIALGGTSYAVVATNDGGVFYSSNNGNTWDDRINGYNVTQFYDADKHPVLNSFIGGTQDNGTNLSPQNSASGDSWDEVIGGDGFECAWNKADGNVVYGSLYYSRIYKSYDGGNNFQSLGNGLPESGIFYTSLAIAAENPEVLLVVGNGDLLFRTSNGGDSWEAVSGNFTSSSKKIEFSAANSEIAWATSLSSGINVSTDFGHHFNGVTTPPGSSNSSVLGIGTDPILDSTAFVTFGVSGFPKVFRTDDLGQTWTDLSSNLPDIPVYDLIVMPFDSSRFWIGTDIGLFESLDAGLTWEYASNGIPAVSIRKLKIVGQEIVAATHGRGIWSVHLDELPLLEIPTIPPLLSKLSPPPPNSPTLSIRYSSRSDHDSLEVYINGLLTEQIGNTVAYTAFTSSYSGFYGEVVEVQIVGYTEGIAYYSDIQTMPLFAPVQRYAETFDSTEVNILGDLGVGPAPGFDSNLLQTYHPYSSGLDYYSYVATPIIIDQSSTMTYTDVALVETGEPGSAYPDQDMWDFVTVEGSLDGNNWEILIVPYDASFDAVWTQEYNSENDPNQQMLRSHSINLYETYAPGDTVSLRFRLFADAAVTGWGWAINDYAITSTSSIGNEASLPLKFNLLPNYPNPFNASTTIPFTVGSNGRLSLSIYDMLGREIRTLINDRPMLAGQGYSTNWNGLDNQGHVVSSGLYLLRMNYEGGSFSRKLMLLK